MNPPPMVKSHKLLNWTEPLTTILEEKGEKREEEEEEEGGGILDRRFNRSSSQKCKLIGNGSDPFSEVRDGEREGGHPLTETKQWPRNEIA